MLDTYDAESMAASHHYHHSLSGLNSGQPHQFDDYQMNTVGLMDESLKYGGGGGNGGGGQSVINQSYNGIAVAAKRGSLQMFGLPFDPAPNICVDKNSINRYHVYFFVECSDLKVTQIFSPEILRNYENKILQN